MTSAEQATERNVGGWRPRVLVIPSSYFAGERTVGGGERYALEFAKALARLTSCSLGLFDVSASVRNEGPLEIRTFEVREKRDRWLFPLTRRSFRELGQYDILHLMIFPTPATDALVLQARLRGQMVILTDVGGGVPSLSTYLQRVHPRLAIGRLAHGLALLSQHSAGHFQAWPHPKVLLYGGAPGVQAKSSQSQPEPYALFVGRLLPHKGVLELIHAMDSGTRLHIVGRPYDADYFARLQQAAEGKNVHFLTAADDLELERQYSGARLVLQPSVPVLEGYEDTSELLGLVALEGMAYGKPVIVTAAGSLPELVVDEKTGFVVPPRDIPALSARIGLLMGNAELATRMGSAAREHVIQLFTWERVARRAMDFYTALRPLT